LVPSPIALSVILLSGLLRVSKHNKILKGVKTEKNLLIALLETSVIYTLKWNYKKGRWNWGSPIHLYLRSGQPCLNTGDDGDTNYDIVNLMNMNIQPV